jgi:hypothetical protein
VVAAAAAVAAVAAFAATGNRHAGPRVAVTARDGVGPFAGGPFGARGGGPVGPGFPFGRLFGGQGPFGGAGPFGGFGLGGLRAGGAGLLGMDILTPAASYLGISAADLQSDLKSGKTLGQEATAKGKTASGLVDAIVAAEQKVLDADKAAGWLTDDQETALLARMKDAIAELVSSGPPVPKVAQPGLLQSAADYLAISVGDLQSDLRSGKSLADEAAAKGKTVDGLVQALLAPVKSELDSRVKAGDITQAQEDAILDKMKTALTNLANRKPASKTASALESALRHVVRFHL